MKLGNLCSRGVLTVPPHAPLSEVATVMRDGHVGAVVVTADQVHVAGILTDRDIVRAQLKHSADLSRLSAGDSMTPNPLVIEEGASVEAAISDLRARGVRRAPVVTADGSLVGLISLDDLIVHVAMTLNGVACSIAKQVRQEA